MKRGYKRTASYCKVCDGSWSRRHFKGERTAFDLLNAGRRRGTHQHLNDEQVHLLLRHYFDSYGEHRTLCRKHLIELASISVRKVAELIEMAQHPVDWEKPVFDPPPPRPNWPPHRLLPPEVDLALLDFLEEHSTPLPNKNGYSLDSSLRSKREVFRAFLDSNPELRLTRPTFLSHWARLRPDIALHTHQTCACSTCTAYHSEKEKHKKIVNDPGSFPCFALPCLSHVWQSFSLLSSHTKSTCGECAPSATSTSPTESERVS